ncbi:hypothetical protein HDU93_002250 [Gonapodya sp. JEL0774]|nr:hypothetical protein HDU93_002250 [Gonapodya sp. JEL0774]
MKAFSVILAAALLSSRADGWVLNPGPTFGAVAKNKVWPKASSAWKTLDGSPSFSACHRGSRWHLPEESAGAYWEGALTNCEWNEPDIVWTSDGVPMVSHDSFADPAITNVGTNPYFAGKNRTLCSLFEDQYLCQNKYWFSDFNVTEVKLLNEIQNTGRAYPKGYRPNFYDSTFKVLTFQEFIDININVSTIINTTLGLIPELKQPFLQNTQVLNKVDNTTEAKFRKAYFDLVDGIDPTYNHTAEDNFMALLKKNNLPSARNPVVIQCFEYETIQYLARKYPNKSGFNALLFLLDINWWPLTPKGMDRIAALQKETNNTIYVGPWKDSLYDGIYLYALSTSAGYGIDYLDAKTNPDLQYPGYKVTDIVDPDQTVNELHKRKLGYLGYTYYDSRQDPLYNCVDPAGYKNITEVLAKLWYTPKPCPKNKRMEFFDQFAMGVDGFFVENNAEFAQLRNEYNNLLLATTPPEAFVLARKDMYTQAMAFPLEDSQYSRRAAMMDPVHFFDTAYHQSPPPPNAHVPPPIAANFNPRWGFHDGLAELYFDDMEHVHKTLSCEYTKKVVGPDALRFIDFSAGINVLAREVDIISGPKDDTNGSVTAILALALANLDGNAEAALTTQLTDILLQEIGKGLLAFQANYAMQSTGDQLSKYFGTQSGTPQLSVVYIARLAGPELLHVFREAQKRFEDATAGKLNLQNSFVALGRRGLVFNTTTPLGVAAAVALVYAYHSLGQHTTYYPCRNMTEVTIEVGGGPRLFPGLPSELQGHVLVYLDPESLSKIRLANKAGNDILREPTFRARWLIAHYTTVGALYWGLKKHRALLRLRSPDTGETVVDALVIQGVRVSRYLLQEFGLWLFNMDSHYRYSQIEALTDERPLTSDDQPPSGLPRVADHALYGHLLKHAMSQYPPDSIRFAHSDIYIARMLTSPEDVDDLPQQVGADNSWIGQTKAFVQGNLPRLLELVEQFDFVPVPPVFLHRYQNDSEALNQLVVEILAGLAIGAPDLLSQVLIPTKTILSFAEAEYRLPSAIAGLYERIMEKTGPTADTPKQLSDVLIHPDFPRALCFPREVLRCFLERQDIFYLNYLRDTAARVPEPDDPEFAKEVDEFLMKDSEEAGIAPTRQRTGKADIFVEALAKNMFRSKWDQLLEPRSSGTTTATGAAAAEATTEGTPTSPSAAADESNAPLVIIESGEKPPAPKRQRLDSTDQEIMTNIVKAMWAEPDDRVKFLKRLVLDPHDWAAELAALSPSVPFSDVPRVVGLPKLKPMDGSRVNFVAEIFRGLLDSNANETVPTMEAICSEDEKAEDMKSLTTNWMPGPCVLATVAFGGAILISKFMAAGEVKNIDRYLRKREWPPIEPTLEPTASTTSVTSSTNDTPVTATPVTAGLGSATGSTSSVSSSVLPSLIETIPPANAESEKEKRTRLGYAMVERLAVCVETVGELMLKVSEVKVNDAGTNVMRSDELARLVELILQHEERARLATLCGGTPPPTIPKGPVSLTGLLPTAASVVDPSFADTSANGFISSIHQQPLSADPGLPSAVADGVPVLEEGDQSPCSPTPTPSERPILTPLSISPTPATEIPSSMLFHKFPHPNVHSLPSLLAYFRLLVDHYSSIIHKAELARRGGRGIADSVLEGSTLRALFSPTSAVPNIEDLKAYEDHVRKQAKPRRPPIKYGQSYGLGTRGNRDTANEVSMEWEPRSPEKVLSKIHIYAGEYLERITFCFSDDTRKSVGRLLFYKPPDFTLVVPPGEHIRSVSGRSGHWIDGVQIQLTDGTKTPYLGGQGGSVFSSAGGASSGTKPVVGGVKAYGATDHYVTKLGFGFCDLEWEQNLKTRKGARSGDAGSDDGENEEAGYTEDALMDLRALFPPGADSVTLLLEVGEDGSEGQTLTTQVESNVDPVGEGPSTGDEDVSVMAFSAELSPTR